MKNNEFLFKTEIVQKIKEKFKCGQWHSFWIFFFFHILVYTDNVISEILKPLKMVLFSSREIVSLKIFTADRMSLVSSPSSNSWTMPLKGPKLEVFFADIFTQIGPVWVGDLGLPRPKIEKSLENRLLYIKIKYKAPSIKNSLTRPKI